MQVLTFSTGRKFCEIWFIRPRCTSKLLHVLWNLQFFQLRHRTNCFVDLGPRLPTREKFWSSASENLDLLSIFLTQILFVWKLSQWNCMQVFLFWISLRRPFLFFFLCVELRLQLKAPQVICRIRHGTWYPLSAF